MFIFRMLAANKERFQTALHHFKYDGNGEYEMPAGMVPNKEEAHWVQYQCTFNISDGYHRIMVKGFKK
jgi:hypothetical protein